MLVNPVLTIVIVLLIFGIGLFIYLKSKGKITFGMKEVKEISKKVMNFIKNVFIKIKELINKIVEWYKKLNKDQKKKANIGICVVILLLLSLIVIPNVINEHSDTNDYYDYEEKDIDDINDKDEESSAISYTIDYKNAEDFEKDLNDGKKVKGKVVMFIVNDYKPDSALGINCWAGEHLNFISGTELDVKKGYTVIGKVTEEPTIVLGSWKVEYKVLEIKKETNDNLIEEEIQEESKKIKLENDSSYYVGKDSSEVKKELEKLGFTNIEINKVKTDDSKNKNNTITELLINDKEIDIETDYNVDDKIIITCWKYEKPVSNYELAFIRDMSNYDLYFMFDEDTNEVVYFGTNDSGVMKSKYSGNFNAGVDINWEKYQEGWHDTFIYKDDSTVATYIDGNGFEFEYKKCDLKKAQSVLDSLE